MTIKSINYLPEIFKSDTNRKFLAATMDQLVSEADTSVRLNSYIGRKNALTHQPGDTFVSEPTKARGDYQLEASTLVDVGSGQITFYASYLDLLQQIAYNGGLVNDHSRLFSTTSYNFNGLFDFDKFVNYAQYVWLPNGPPEITISASAVDPALTYVVTRSQDTQGYNFTEFGINRNPTVQLLKGTSYRFQVNQPGVPFWIQIEPGVTGSNSAAAEKVNRNIYGVKNNGIDVGVIEFSVPTSDAQGTAATATLVDTVDYATTLNYNQVQSHLNNILKLSGGLDGVSDGLNGKKLIFYGQATDNSLWTDPGNFDTGLVNNQSGSFDFTGEGFEYGTTVPAQQRYHVFVISTQQAGSRQLIKLLPSTQVAVGEKIRVAAGNEFSNTEFIKNPSGFFEIIDTVTAPLTELYYQDAVSPEFFGTFSLQEPGTEILDVTNNVLDRENYTSPNGVTFSNGMHVRFDNTATPERFRNNAYLVEGVGRAIKLLSIGNFAVPEQYAVDSQVADPDYITINRASSDQNGWSRSNRWFHYNLLELAADYLEDKSLLTILQSQRAKRPIIEFEADLFLFAHGRNGKSPIDILDFTVTDAFRQVEGQSQYIIQMPNGVTRELTFGTRIIFANDLDPEVRTKIYTVIGITVASGTILHLESTNTQNLPTYSVVGVQVTANIAYNFVPTAVFSAPLPGIGTRICTGNVVLKPTGVANINVLTGGINYVADPYISISTEFDNEVEYDIVYRTRSQLDHVRIDNRGTGYAYQANVIIDNPNEYYATLSNADISSSGTTFEIQPGALQNVVLTSNIATDINGNLSNLIFSNIGLGYFAGNVTANISAPDTPAGVTATVNQVFLFANGAVKAVNILNPGSGYLTNPVLTISSTGNTFAASTGNVGTLVSSAVSLWDFLVPGMQVVANGITGGTVITAVDNAANLITINLPAVVADRTLESPRFGLATVETGDTWTFFSTAAGASFATVSATVFDSDIITVDDTSALDVNMIVDGGSAPVDISAVNIATVPTRVITAVEHNLQPGDLVYFRGINGTTDLNFTRFFAKIVSSTAIDLFTDPNLIDGAQDSRNYDEYISGGTATSYTIDFAQTKVVQIFSSTQFRTNRPVTIKSGTKLVFAGVRATAIARTDSSSVYNISLTDPGSGYTTTPNVAIQYNGSGNPALATAIVNDGIINYVQITNAGNGYVYTDNVSAQVVASLNTTTQIKTVYGTNTLTFAQDVDLSPVQQGWLVFLITRINGQDVLTDFAQTPYTSAETTGPNSSDYRFFIDVTKTTATILSVINVDSDTLTLSGPIQSRDSDGELIDLPAGSRIFITAQNRFFLENNSGDGEIVLGDTQIGFSLAVEALDTVTITLNTVQALQAGMVLQTRSDILLRVIKITAVDSYLNRITLDAPVTLPAGTALKFSNSARLSTALTASAILTVVLSDNGRGYTSAPLVTIQSLFSDQTRLASCLGGTGQTAFVETADLTQTVFYNNNLVLRVDSFENIVLGSKVFSEFDPNGVGITTGSDIPVVTALAFEQTGSNTFEPRIILDIAQSTFDDVFVTFKFAAQAVANTEIENSDTNTTDTTPETYEAGDTVCVSLPANEQQTANNIVAYNMFVFNGEQWLPAQQKSKINQAPLFDCFDVNGSSARDAVAFPGSKFTGTKVFGYAVGTGKNDAALGFPLRYKNFNNVGDIEFINFFSTDSFAYLNGINEVTLPINNLVLQQKTASGTSTRNIWTEIEEPNKQAQIIVSDFDGTTNYFEIDILPAASRTVPYIKVLVDSVRVPESGYQIVQSGGRKAVIVAEQYLTIGSRVVIEIFSAQQTSIGHYKTPVNLDFNPANASFDTLTLGQIRQHLVVQVDNHYGVVGRATASNNLRDLDSSRWQGNILQHSALFGLVKLFMIDKEFDAYKAIEFAQKEYIKFKNRFLDTAGKSQLSANIPQAVDQILNSIMLGKSAMTPWYDSDMLAYGSKFKTVYTVQVLNTLQRSYLIPNTFDPTVLSRRSVLVYLTDPLQQIVDQQLLLNVDFSFATAISSVVIENHVTLTNNTTITVIDYADTTSCYVPETPSKLGLYPKFIPGKLYDDTYQTPISVIQGHDGSLTPAFNDFRDDLLIELEKRIYNNIKVRYDTTLLQIYNVLPGRFRTSDYSKNEFDKLLTKSFLGWVGSNNVDYSSNTFFEPNNSWTWNYSTFTDQQGMALPGHWRGIFKHFYDTDRPHQTPWEMLGFSLQPDWWIEQYGRAPYTSGNKVMWEHLEVGLILQGPRAGYDYRFARPGLSSIIPVDDNGTLKSPMQFLVANFDSANTNRSFAIGDQGPVETAWRRSSNFPYAVQLAFMLAKPAVYLGTLFDVSRYAYDQSLQQIVYSGTRQRANTRSLLVPDIGNNTTFTLTAGYANWIRDNLKARGIGDLDKLARTVQALDIRLSYHVAGFTDKKMLAVLAEQSSPGGSGTSIVVPDESYKVYLHKGTPVRRITYSAVIVEKTPAGYRIRGYDTLRPYFTIVPSEINNNNFALTELSETVLVYRDYKFAKIDVPYGTEYSNAQQIADFLNSYSRYLLSQGFVFDEVDADLNVTRDWNLSTREFLTWIQQGWRDKNVLVLSPIGSKITHVSSLGVVDKIANKTDSNRLLDQNFSLIRNGEFSVTRNDNVFTATTLGNQMIAFADLSLTSYEHVLIFDNRTVFNDVIYEPALGSRQLRLKVIGRKSGEWNGQLYAPGYIYNDSNVQEWQATVEYGVGSLVLHKGKLFVALQKSATSAQFQYSNWEPIGDTDIQTGLISNFSNNANKFKNFYDIDKAGQDETFSPYAAGLVGFRERDYFTSIGVPVESQLKFYQGYIKQKGTKNAVTALNQGQFDRVSSELDFFEEWALRIGEYGATGSDQYIELVLAAEKIVEDPATLVLLAQDQVGESAVVNYTPADVFRTSQLNYSPNVIKTRLENAPRIIDNVTAGYPRLDDIDGTLYDIAQYQNYFQLIENLGIGFKLWVAVDTNKLWNIYRATETDILLTTITRLSASVLQFTFDKPHVTPPGALVVVKNFFDKSFDGFYRVITVVDGLSITVTGYRGLSLFTQLTQVISTGVYLRMISVRFSQVSDIINFTPAHGWLDQDRVWIDSDTGPGTWGVYNKTLGWNFNQLAPLRVGEERVREGYGSEIRLNIDNTLLVAGTPKFTTGTLQGLRVLATGSNYLSPAVLVSSPTGTPGQQAQFSATIESGKIIFANLVTNGSGYTFAPNISIIDQYTAVTVSETVTDEFLFFTAPDIPRIFIGDFVSGQGVPVGTQVVEITPALSRIKIDGPSVPSFSAATTVTVGLGAKTFVTAVSAATTTIVAGQGIRIYKTNDNLVFMEGYVISFVGQTLVIESEIVQGSGTFSSWLVTTSLSVRTGTTILFQRGRGATISARLSPTQLETIQVQDGGSGFIVTPVVDIIGGGGSGAAAVVQISGGTITGVTVTNPGSGYTENPQINLFTNNPVPVTLTARLRASGVAQLIIVDQGQDYREPVINLTTDTRDFANTALGTLNFYGNGGISSVSVTNRGTSYGNTAIISIENSNTGSGFLGNVNVFANGRVANVSVFAIGSGYNVSTATANIFYSGGSGVSGVITSSVNGIADFGALNAINLGQGYVTPPTVQIIDLAGSGSGAVVEAVFPTGQTKSFVRADQNADLFEEIQLLKPFNSNTREFGFSIDVMTTLLAVGAPGSYDQRGGVLISTVLGTQFITEQILFPQDLAAQSRFGHSVAMSTNQQWLYVGAPGINRVYCYAQKNQATERAVIVPVTGQLTYSTNITGLLTARELKVIGTSGKVFEANFDYTVDSAGNIYWADFTRISGQSRIFITRQRLQTTIIPTVIQNITQRSYTLVSRPSTIDQLIVFGATGTVFVPFVDYAVIGNSIVFLNNNFVGEASITVAQKDKFYSLVDILQPPDGVNADANFGASVKIDQFGYRILVGAPDTDEILNGDTIPSAGRVYVFARSREITLALNNLSVVTLNQLRTVVSVFVDNILQDEFINYTIQNNSVVFTVAPRNGSRISVDTNFFNLVQIINCPSIVNLGRFGASVDISPDNDNFAVGSPGYRDDDYYNGTVYRYVNKGLFYGTVTSEKSFLQANSTQGDTIKINDTTVTFDNAIPGQTANVTAVFSALSDTITISPNVALQPGDVLSGPEISGFVQFLSYDTPLNVDSANVLISSSVTVSAGEALKFTRGGDNIDKALAKLRAAGIVGVQGAVVNGNIEISVVPGLFNNRLDISPGTNGTALIDLGIKVYELTQTITHPRYGVPEKFGTKVVLDNTGKTILIASEGGNTLKKSTFDKLLTLFDKSSTKFVDNLNASGAVYVYDYLNPPGETLANPGKLLYNQVLENAFVQTGDNFGSAVDINKGYAVVGADTSSFHGVLSGAVHLFKNVTGVKGWSRSRSRGPVIDIDYINSALLYDNKRQIVLQDLDYFDPVKGKILGSADKDLDYKSSYDPAQYNRTTRSELTGSDDSFWNTAQETQTWWDLSLVRYIDYEQGSIGYRSANWGRIFPDSNIQVCEWISSNYLPSQYAENNNDGQAKYPDDSAYSETLFVDSQSGLIRTQYFYWVIDKRNVDKIKTKRTTSIITLQQLIGQPDLQGVPYFAAIASNSFNIYNVKNIIDSDQTVFRVEYSNVISEIISHNEYQLVQQGKDSVIPVKLINKLIDSLSGEDIAGGLVPDVKLASSAAYGISNLPKQSMIVDARAAAKVFVTFVNRILRTQTFAKFRNLERLRLAEAIPPNVVTIYNITVDTVEQLNYIPSSEIFVGVKVLVRSDAEFFGYWTIYEYQSSTIGFRMIRIQSYDTTRWWSLVDWYAPDVNIYTNIDYTVPRYNDTLRLDLEIGNTIKVLDTGKGQYSVYRVDNNFALTEIIIQDGTLQLSNALFDSNASAAGFDNAAFDQVGFSTTLSTELRNIFTAVANDIFVGPDAIEVNNLFFTLLNYILSEQLTVDYALKTSFINVQHKIRKLLPFANYIKDNQDFYESYINEVKPYRTQIREYVLDYVGDEQVDSALSDFDFPAVYDRSIGNYRVLDTANSNDLAVIQASDRRDWLNNYAYEIQSLVVNNAGSGYTVAPTVTITGGGGTGARARAVILNGAVSSLILVAPGSGYTSTPTVTFSGGNGSAAAGVARLTQLPAVAITTATRNKKIRGISTVLKFDRVDYSSAIKSWRPYEIYQQGDLVVLDDSQFVTFANYTDRALPRASTVYRVLKTLTGRSSIDLNLFEDTSVVQKVIGGNLFTATDRLAAYNKPGSADIARLYASPDTIILEQLELNNQIISVARQWNAVSHAEKYPATHGYQYAAVGDGSLIGTSLDGINWTTNRIINTELNCRDLCFYNNNDWVIVANQGTYIVSSNGVDWTVKTIAQYYYQPSVDNPTGRLQLNTAQTIDLTGTVSVATSYGNYLVVVGNNGFILASAQGNSNLTTLPFVEWYQLPVQNLIDTQNYLKIISVDRGLLQDIDGTTYDVVITPASGYYLESNSLAKKSMKAGVIFTTGVNGAINAISFNAFDDYLQGYLSGYNYDNGKNNVLSYPWQQLDVPVEVKGTGDGLSGQQLTSMAVSGANTNWVVAVGSGGVLLYNQFNLPIMVQDGRAELAPDTIGQTVIDHGVYLFNNFRYFDDDNFVAPLTKQSLARINFQDITWDGEKFIAVGTRGTILWGYPAAKADAYIELGSLDPSIGVSSRRASGQWTGGNNINQLTLTIAAADLDAFAVVVGMTCYALGVPADAVVTAVVVGTTTHTITVSFIPVTVTSASERALTFAYVITNPIAANTVLTFGNTVDSVNLTVSANVAVGSTRIYVNDYDERVQSNWSITGSGIPASARVKYVGKFANYNWQYATGYVDNINLDYRAVSVNTTVVEISKPLLPVSANTAGVFAGNIVTFSDSTGTISQLPVTQNLSANLRVLTLANISQVAVGFTVLANVSLGIQDDTKITRVVNYNIAGVLSRLARDIPDLVPGTAYTGSQVLGKTFTNNLEDNLSLDSDIQSSFTDNMLGQRPEDITIDGGKFIDTYSSFAPEELVPGQLIDSLQMNIFTANAESGNIDYNDVIAYKIFTDYKLPSSYFRLAAANTTVLSANLLFDSAEISITNAAALPDVGSVWINAEKITYQNIDRNSNKLLDIRRGTLRTSVPPVHVAGSVVSDATQSQLIYKDFATPLTENVTVQNGIQGNANSSTYLAATVSSIYQSQIWVDLQ